MTLPTNTTSQDDQANDKPKRELAQSDTNNRELEDLKGLLLNLALSANLEIYDIEATEALTKYIAQAVNKARIETYQHIIDAIVTVNGSNWETGTVTGSALVKMRNQLTQDRSTK